MATLTIPLERHRLRCLGIEDLGWQTPPASWHDRNMPSRPSKDHEFSTGAPIAVTNKPLGRSGKPIRSASPPEISKLGQRLRAISDKALASGVTVLSREEIKNLLLETRGGSTR
jgi:hypothetical protein